MRRRLAAAFEHFEDVSALPDDLLAEHLAALGVDILVDLGGHTSGSRTRVLAYRPAAAQISFLGFPGTLGADFIDYLIADRQVIPEADRRHYAEQVIYMPDTYLPTGFAGPQPPAPARAAVGYCPRGHRLLLLQRAFKFRARNIERNGLGSSRPFRPRFCGSGRLGGDEARSRREAAERGVDPARLISSSAGAEHR